MIATGDEKIANQLKDFKQNLKQKIVTANKDLEEYKFEYRVIS